MVPGALPPAGTLAVLVVAAALAVAVPGSVAVAGAVPTGGSAADPTGRSLAYQDGRSAADPTGGSLVGPNGTTDGGSTGPPGTDCEAAVEEATNGSVRPPANGSPGGNRSNADPRSGRSDPATPDAGTGGPSTLRLVDPPRSTDEAGDSGATRLAATTRTTRLEVAGGGPGVVAYCWDVDGDGSVDANTTAPVLWHRFPTENRTYRVTVAVLDRQGRAGATTVGIRTVPNDRPVIASATATGVGECGQGAVELAATVEDRVGNVTVTWVLPDGDRVPGASAVAYLPPDGSTHTVRAVAEDEYGARATANATVTVCDPSDRSGGRGRSTPGPGVAGTLLAVAVGIGARRAVGRRRT